MVWPDGLCAAVESGYATEHEQRQQQLPTSEGAKAIAHIQAPRILTAGQTADMPGRPAGAGRVE